MNELVLVRHGEADHMVTNLTGGWSDTHLTELGKRQAVATGKCLSSLIGDRPFRLYSSDLARAAETADLIAASFCVTPNYVDGLRELNNGAAANLTQEEATAIAIPMTHPAEDWTPYPGAESWRDMTHRVALCMESIRSERDEICLLVTHGNSGNAVICWWLGLEIGKHNIAFKLDVCSISRFNINNYGEKTIMKLNDTAHLISPIVTTSAG